jgi:hypothetical protein
MTSAFAGTTGSMLLQDTQRRNPDFSGCASDIAE